MKSEFMAGHIGCDNEITLNFSKYDKFSRNDVCILQFEFHPLETCK